MNGLSASAICEHPDSRRITLRVPAKINLFLHVTGRRADGYHLLESIFCPVDCCDLLTLELSDTPGVRRAGGLDGVAPDEDLCVKAAKAFMAASGQAQGVDIALHKFIPAGAGMGGGSADAAFTLLGLNRLCKDPLSMDALAGIAVRLGADVPFFLLGKPAFVSGIGEILDPIDIPALPLVILKPPVHMPTARIFTSPHLTRDSAPVKIAVFGFSDTRSRLQYVSGHTTNSLQSVAERESDGITQALRLFQTAPDSLRPLWYRMTGSGSAVFGVYDSSERARLASEFFTRTVVAAHRPNPWFVWCGQTLTSACLNDQTVLPPPSAPSTESV